MPTEGTSAGKWLSPWALINSVEPTCEQLNSMLPVLPSQGRLSPEVFEFVNLVTPNHARDPKFKKVVWKHVWKGRRKKGQRLDRRAEKENTRHHVASNITGLAREDSTVRSLNGRQISSGPLTILGNSINDSGLYPVTMTAELHELVVHLHDKQFDDMAAFRHVWFAMILNDEASFYQNMSTIRHHLGILRGESDHSRARSLYMMAVRSVNKRLSDPISGVTDKMIGAVICFLTHAHITRDLESYKLHKGGLARMVAVRGGIQALDMSYNVRLMVLWQDKPFPWTFKAPSSNCHRDEVCGGCAFDIPPRYPLPTALLPPLRSISPGPTSTQIADASTAWVRVFGSSHLITDIIQELHTITAVIRDQDPFVWRDPCFLGLQVNPVVHRLLSVDQNPKHSNANDDVLARACALAALLFLDRIRRKFMPYHITGPHFEQRLYGILTEGLIDWTEFPELELWLLITFSMNADPSRTTFVARITQLIDMLGLQTWDLIVEVLSGFLWLDNVVLYEGAVLQENIKGMVYSLQWYFGDYTNISNNGLCLAKTLKTECRLEFRVDLLSQLSWETASTKIRGITRNVTSAKAQNLTAQGVEMLKAYLDDEESLIRAFEGVYAIYAVTDFFEPFGKHGPEVAVKVEVAQGINLASAASKTPSLTHYIWSTLPNGKKTSGKYVWLQPTPPSTKITILGDATVNIGPYVSGILRRPDLSLPGKFVLATTEEMTHGEILEAWSRATSKEAEYVEISLKGFDRLWPMWGIEMGSMLKMWEDLGAKSWSGEKVVTKEDLGITQPLTSLEAWFKAADWGLTSIAA
ncbi:hypothetical protein V500_03158 [Pseudogymnoascus sp. VKM F-4518 (FW-2643)]|nr:hypothetical protein V500_03158 [Pseudogymnoascus sp. VKM F-4518 (FW-2643)]